MKEWIKFFLAKPEGWSAIMVVTLHSQDRHQEGFAFYGVFLLPLICIPVILVVGIVLVVLLESSDPTKR